MGLKEDVKTGAITLDRAIQEANLVRRSNPGLHRYNDSIRGWLARRKKRGGPGPSGEPKCLEQ